MSHKTLGSSQYILNLSIFSVIEFIGRFSPTTCGILLSSSIFKNNAPRYLVIQFAIADQVEDAAKYDALASASRMMDLYDDAFKELAK